MNPTKQQELLDFWEYEHGFDNEDGATSIDEDISYEASRQELQIELEHFNEMDLDQELHPIKDDDFQPEDEHSNKTMLKRELRAIALKRLEDSARTVSDFEEVIKEWDHLDDNRERKERYHEIGRENIDSKKDVAPLAIIVPAPINHAYWRQLMKGDFIDIISNCPYEMHNSLSDEDYSKIIYDLKDNHKELIYFLYLRDFTTNQLAAMRNQSDRNIRGVRSTVLGQIEKKVLLVLADRLGQDFPFTGEERDFLSKHAKDLPAALEKLDKEKLALLKKIGVMARKIAREQTKLEQEQEKIIKKNNNKNNATEDGLTKIETTFDEDTVWLSLDQMAELFQRDKSTISRHIKNIFEEGELQRNSVVAKFATTASDGKTYQVDHYNLDVIISVGYRVKSHRGTQFRIWAMGILKEYMKKGFALDDDRLKRLGGGNYFDELLARIRDIRSSEKVFWRKVLEIYATSIDYDPHAESSVLFFKQVQNKMHWAAHKHTAAEVIYERADAEKENMGLTSWEHDEIRRSDVEVAKNYLTEQELDALNKIVTAYLDIAEVHALNKEPMYMKDWLETIDDYLKMTRRDILTSSGRISHKQAMEKAHAEYDKYKNRLDDTLSPVEKDFIESIGMLEQITDSSKK